MLVLSTQNQIKRKRREPLQQKVSWREGEWDRLQPCQNRKGPPHPHPSRRWSCDLWHVSALAFFCVVSSSPFASLSARPNQPNYKWCFVCGSHTPSNEGKSLQKNKKQKTSPALSKKCLSPNEHAQESCLILVGFGWEKISWFIRMSQKFASFWAIMRTTSSGLTCDCEE